jgi:hypothetical protein
MNIIAFHIVHRERGRKCVRESENIFESQVRGGKRSPWRILPMGGNGAARTRATLNDTNHI